MAAVFPFPTLPHKLSKSMRAPIPGCATPIPRFLRHMMCLIFDFRNGLIFFAGLTAMGARANEAQDLPFTLQGVFGPANDAQASLRNKETANSAWVAAGESHDGWLLTSFDVAGGKAIFFKDGKTAVLKLPGEGAAPPPGGTESIALNMKRFNATITRRLILKMSKDKYAKAVSAEIFEATKHEFQKAHPEAYDENGRDIETFKGNRSELNADFMTRHANNLAANRDESFAPYKDAFVSLKLAQLKPSPEQENWSHSAQIAALYEEADQIYLANGGKAE